MVDGGSDDSGPVIVESFANMDSRIRLVKQESKGVSNARNQGVRESKFELIAFLDADDEWIPNYLETILRLRKKYSCVGLYATSIKNEFTDSVLMELSDKSRILGGEKMLICGVELL